MKWMKYTIHTTTEAEELLCDFLNECEVTGIEIDNFVPVPDEAQQGGVFEELQPNIPEDDGSSRVSFYLPIEEASELLLEKITQYLLQISEFIQIGSGKITTEESDELDWRDNWKAYFSAFCVGDIVIKPTWEQLTEDKKGKTIIEIDPGVSFGTGKHESTQLVIKQMPTYLKPNAKVLDIGCGSGILSIVALKLGAEKIVGTDIEKDCILSTYDNFQVNHLEKSLGDFYVGNLIEDVALQEKVGAEEYDLVLANILADIIIPMAPQIAKAMKPDTYVITSGIIDFKEQEVIKGLEKAGLEYVSTMKQGEWRSVVAKKPGEVK